MTDPQVIGLGSGRYLVASQTNPDIYHRVLVRLDGAATCSCPSGEHRPTVMCRHLNLLHDMGVPLHPSDEREEIAHD